MSSRRWMTWAIFLICALLVVDGLGFVTWQVLRLEWREAEAAIESARQEKERLALWRMDFVLAQPIGQESTRPYFHYLPFYPAERAYNRMWEQVQPGDVVMPSPLLTSPRSQTGADLIRLYFQFDQRMRFSSPQVPTGNQLDLAEGRFGMAGQIEKNEELLKRVRAMFIEQVRAEAERRSDHAGAQPQSLARRSQTEAPDADQQDKADAEAAEPTAKPDAEFELRSKSLEQATSGQTLLAVPPVGDVAPEVERSLPQSLRDAGRGGVDASIRVGSFRPMWLRSEETNEPELVFVRQVTTENQVVQQGFWIDWPMLRTLLITSSLDLLPEAKLVPTIEAEAGDRDGARMLASLPAVLEPGPLPEPGPLGMTWVRATLGATWLAIVAAVVAIGWVLRASLNLSDRRGRFVSAVTHELRTPLTTFCLYTEMLSEGMVDVSARQSYLQTLRSEAKRLAGIVENVLAYARLGRAKPKGDGTVGVSDLLAQVTDPLVRRAEQAEAELAIDVSEEARVAKVRGQPEAIERVLFNLVDNACKYGRVDDEPAQVRLTVELEHHRAVFRVCDQGPGIRSGERERIFGAFQRGAVQDSHAESGLGLGLALARGLAEEMGGELVLEPAAHGACFALRLRLGHGQGS